MYTCIEAKNCYYVNLKLYIMTSSFYIKNIYIYSMKMGHSIGSKEIYNYK